MSEKKVENNNDSGSLAYVFGGISFIPLIGVMFGIVAIALGIASKKRPAIILGFSGIAFTFLIYGSLFYFGSVANYGPYHEMKKDLTKSMLAQTRGQILIFKEENKKLPTKLTELGNPTFDSGFFSINDPWFHDIEYTVNSDGTFELRSYGPDGIPNNDDDIVSP